METLYQSTSCNTKLNKVFDSFMTANYVGVVIRLQDVRLNDCKTAEPESVVAFIPEVAGDA